MEEPDQGHPSPPPTLRNEARGPFAKFSKSQMAEPDSAVSAFKASSATL